MGEEEKKSVRATKHRPAWQQSETCVVIVLYVVVVAAFISVIVCLFASLFFGFLIGEHWH